MILTNPIFLIGLVAVGIPIAIHLLQLRRYRKVYFSNVDALQELQDENRRRHQVRQWLVLAMRILAITFLVLAFCRPVVPGKMYQMKSGATAISVYVDNSYSMECGGMNGSLMESAREKAREIVAAYSPDDRFQLLTGDATGSQFRWLSRDEFLNELDRIQTTAATPRLSTIAHRQNDFLKSSNAANRHAYIISDFQHSTTDLSDFPADSVVSTTFIPLGASNVNNLYIDTLLFNSPAYSKGATASVQVTLKNNGSQAVESVPLRLIVAGRPRAVASVDLPAGGAATVPMIFSIDQEGTLQGYVETTDYPVTFDDRLWFTLNVAREIPVTVIGGKEENEYLRRLYAHDTLVTYQFMPQNRIDYTRIAENRMIVLDQLHDIPSGLAQTLLTFIEEGGTLVILPNEHIDRGSYNRFLTACHAPRIGQWNNSRMTVQQIDTRNRLFNAVFDGNTDDIETPTVTGHFTTETDAQTRMEPILTLADGSQMLVGCPVAGGALYLFTTALQKDYTDFMLQSLFVPTLYNMALYSTPPQQPYHLPDNSTPILLQGNYAGDEIPHLRSVDTSVDLIPDIRRIGGHYMLIPHGEMLNAGNYTLADEGLSFNYSRSESDLTVYNTTELQQLIHDYHLVNCSLVNNARKSLTEHIRERSQGTPLWRLCLILVLLFLASETILLRRWKNER